MLAFMPSDRAVVRKVLAGNLAAFRILVDRYGAVVHGVAYSRLRNAADAEDVAQDTFLRFYQHLDQMGHRRHVGSWLVRVARNASIDLLRKRSRANARLEVQPVHAHVPDPMREELHRLLWEQMEKLDPDTHEVLVLHYFMKKKAREIASLLEIQPNTAEKRLQRAREELGRRLTELLGEEIEEVKPDGRRGDRIMAAICASPVGWKVSAAGAGAAATAAGVATGAGAAKLAAGAAVAVAVVLAVYLAYERGPAGLGAEVMERPAAVEVVAQEEAVAEVADAPALPEVKPAEEKAAGGVAKMSWYGPVRGVVKGTVTREDGTPAAGVAVWLDNDWAVAVYSDQGFTDDAYEPIRPLRLSTQADSLGNYLIENVPLVTLGRYWAPFAVSAEAPGMFASARFEANYMDREVVVNLTLQRDVSLGGKVVDGGGLPVKDAKVDLVSQDHEGVLRLTRSDAEGVFLFEHLTPGMFHVDASAKGYIGSEPAWLDSGRLDHVLEVERGCLVSGRVVDMAGRPLAGVMVRGYGANTEEQKRWYNQYSFRAETDSEGRFEVTGFKPEVYGLAVEPKWGETLALTLVEPATVTVGAEPVTGLVLKTSPGAVLRGKVIDEEGTPIPAGSRVWAGASNNAGGHGRGCEIAADGSYELLGLPAGDLETSVRFPLDTTTRYEGTVTLAAGEVKENHEIRLKPRRFAGVVVDELGKPLPWATVYAADPKRGRSLQGFTLTDEQGWFAFDLLSGGTPPAVLYVQALSDDGYSAPAGPYEAGAGDQNIRLRIVRSGRLEGEVLTADGMPFRTGRVAALPDTSTAVLLRALGDEPVERSLWNGSRFEFAKLHPGRYTIEVRHSGLDRTAAPLATAVVSVQTGRTTQARLVVDMAGYGGVEGVVLRDGKPAYNEYVCIKSAGLEHNIVDVSGADGRYSVCGVPPGPATVIVDPSRPPGRQAMYDEKNVEIVAGTFSTVDFESVSGKAGAEGTVQVDGAPVEYAEVTFALQHGAGGARVMTTADRQGYYRVENVVEGVYRVEAWTETARGVVEARLAAGQTARIDFDLRTCAIHGWIEGLRPEEKAVVVVLPADAELSEWTAETLEALSGQIVAQTEAGQYEKFYFESVAEGDYVIAAVALAADAAFDVESVLGGRVAFSAPFYAGPGAAVEVGVELE